MQGFNILKVLFVCLGNICRSPAAEGVFQALIKRHGLEQNIFCDSAGTSGHHIGDLADSRMRACASARGIDLTSRSRKVTREDLKEFDFVIAMDRSNYEDLKSLGGSTDNLSLMLDYSSQGGLSDVPDPYYGGADGFEVVLDLLEESCGRLFEVVKKAYQSENS